MCPVKKKKIKSNLITRSLSIVFIINFHIYGKLIIEFQPSLNMSCPYRHTCNKPGQEKTGNECF